MLGSKSLKQSQVMGVVSILMLLLYSEAFVSPISSRQRVHSTIQVHRRSGGSARFIFNRFLQTEDSPVKQQNTQQNHDGEEEGEHSKLSFFSAPYRYFTKSINGCSEHEAPTLTATAATASTEEETTRPASGMPDFISFLGLPSSFDATNDELATASAATASSVVVVGDDDDDKENKVQSQALDVQTVVLGFGAVFVTAVLGACYVFGLTVDDVVQGAQTFSTNPQESLQQLLDYVEGAGSAGPLYFGIAYFLAEILAIPATPLTMSAGFLFGVTQGTLTVLIAATFAASFGFVVGKTVLRGTVENILDENPKYAKLDKAIGEEGFPLLLLVRLTPLFPFSLSNYIYGASSIKFPDYFFATLLGFAPGTIAYVYTGQVGQALFTGEGSQPWYVYVGGLAVLAGFLKLVTDAASNIVQALDDDDEE